MLQQRVGDPTGTNGSGVWVSPLRDIAHCTPYLIRRTLEALEADLKTPEQVEAMNDYAAKLGGFINNCVGEESPLKVAELFEGSGLLKASDEIQGIFGKWFTRVILGMYFSAIKEAIHPGEKPLGVANLLKMTVPQDA